MYFLVSILRYENVMVHTSVCDTVKIPTIDTFTCEDESSVSVYDRYCNDGQIISICEIDKDLYERYSSCNKEED